MLKGLISPSLVIVGLRVTFLVGRVRGWSKGCGEGCRQGGQRVNGNEGMNEGAWGGGGGRSNLRWREVEQGHQQIICP